MTVGERIKHRRKELGLTATELAEKLGKDRATVYRYESSYIESMPTSVLEPLAIALKTTPAYLMGWESSAEATKNDIITDIILRLRTDDNLLSLIEDLTKLSEEQLTAVKTFLAAFK